MNQINPVKWSPEWYELTTDEELEICLKEAEEKRHERGESATLWLTRVQRIKEELLTRATEVEMGHD